MLKSLLLILLIFTSHFSNAQPYQMALKHITEENGLSDNHITAFLKDNQNIVWIGTADGLNMLDGSTITVYKNEKNNKNSLASNSINCLLQADDQTIFIGSANCITAFNKYSKLCTQIPLPQSKYGASNIVLGLALDKQNNVWCCTDGGLYCYNTSLKTMRQYANTKVAADEMKVNKLFNFSLGKKEQLWLCTNDGLWCYDILKKIFTRINSNQNDKAYEPLTTAIFEDKKNNIWFGNWSTGLKKYDPSTGKIQNFLDIPNAPTHVIGIGEIELPNGKTILCTNSTLQYFNEKEKDFSHFINSFGSAITPNILNFYTDATKSVWMGSDEGVYIYTPQCQQFQHHIFKENITGQNVNFLELGGRILVGGEGENFLKSYSRDLQNCTDVISNLHSKETTLGLLKMDDDNILISNTGGIIKYNLSTKKETVFKHIENDSTSLPRNFVQNVFIDSKKQCWIFPWRKGIYKMDINTGKCTLKCKGLSNRNGAVKGLVITDAVEDTDGNIWMSDLDEGIIEYDVKANTFLKPFSKQIGEAVHSARIFYRKGYCYSFANNKLLSWHCTDKKLTAVELPNQIDVVDFILDKKNNWWIATKKGLLVYTDSTNTFKNLTTADGLYTNIMDGVLYSKQNGDILFCSNKYISTFNPAILLNTFSNNAQLILTAFQVNGKQILYDTTKKLKLDYTTNNVLFKWAVTDYINPLHNQYYCQLEGIDTGYKFVGNKGEVQYASLSPGSYTLLLNGSTASGDFAKSAIKIKFIITPPFWKTLWFFSICAIALGIILYLIIRKRIKNIRQKALVQQQMSELQLQALRAQMNPHFIFNSLSSIQESIVDNKTEAAGKYLGKFSKLIRMVLENSGKKFITLKEEINYLQLYLELESFRFDDLQFEINCAVEETSFVKIPPMIVQPYIENAIKHGLAHKAGSKKLTVKFYTTASDNLFAEIIDNGIGRTQSAVINQSRMASHQSMGMQITEQRLSLLKGNIPYQIEITDFVDENNKATGTSIKILLPTAL